MKTADLIKRTVFSFVEKQKLFTSVDISQEIKKSGHFVRNTAVRNWLKEHFDFYVEESAKYSFINSIDIPEKFQNYIKSTITVRDGKENATLYKPNWTKDEEYVERDQVPMAPTAVRKVQKTPSIKAPKVLPAADISTLIDSDVQVLVRKLSSEERLRIPGEITRKLGWGAGMVIDEDKAKVIKTDKPLPRGLRINKDDRISIPRGAVAIPNPVRVRCDGYVITFEKA